MKYILTGTASEVAKVIRENRVREARGLIKFTPVPEGGERRKAEVPDTKESVETDTKEPVETDTKEVEDAEAKEPEVTDTKEVKKPKGKK